MPKAAAMKLSISVPRIYGRVLAWELAAVALRGRNTQNASVQLPPWVGQAGRRGQQGKWHNLSACEKATPAAGAAPRLSSGERVIQGGVINDVLGGRRDGMRMGDGSGSIPALDPPVKGFYVRALARRPCRLHARVGLREEPDREPSRSGPRTLLRAAPGGTCRCPVRASAWSWRRADSGATRSSAGRRSSPSAFLPMSCQVGQEKWGGPEGIVRHLGLALGRRPPASFPAGLMVPVSNDTPLWVVRRRVRVPRTPLRVIEHRRQVL